MSKEVLKICYFCAYIFVMFILTITIYTILKQINFNEYVIAFLCVVCSHWLIGEVLKIIKKGIKQDENT